VVEKTPAKPLSKRAQDRLKRLATSLENSNKYTAKLTHNDLSLLEELCRRDQISPGSYPISNTGSSIVSSSHGGSPELTPVERAADISMRGKRASDPLRDGFKRIEKEIFEAENQLRRAVESAEEFFAGVERKRERSTTVPCSACQILPAVRTGFCEGCFDQWRDDGYPDRTRYVLYLQQTTNREGKVLVTEPPPPRNIQYAETESNGVFR
jgi:hypothetical protein